jgi:hypothetical protein
MTWRKINYGAAENESGARVTRTGFRTMTYKRDGREVTIDVEAGSSNLGVYARSISKWDDGSAIDEDARSKILTDVTAALRVLRVPVEVLWV